MLSIRGWGCRAVPCRDRAVLTVGMAVLRRDGQGEITWEHPYFGLWEVDRSDHRQKWMDRGRSWVSGPSQFPCTRKAPSQQILPAGHIPADGCVTFPLPSLAGGVAGDLSPTTHPYPISSPPAQITPTFTSARNVPKAPVGLQTPAGTRPEELQEERRSDAELS